MSIWAAVLAPAMTSADRQTSGSEKRSRGNPRPPRAGGFPKGRAFPSLTCRAGVPTIPRRRQEVCASADRPAEAFFLFGPCNRAAVGGSAALRMRHTPCGYGPFLFWQDQKRNGGCICPAISMAAYTVAALRFPSLGGAANRTASSKPPRFIRRWRRFGDFPRPMGRSLPLRRNPADFQEKS